MAEVPDNEIVYLNGITLESSEIVITGNAELVLDDSDCVDRKFEPPLLQNTITLFILILIMQHLVAGSLPGTYKR